MLYYDILRRKSPNDPPCVHVGRSPKNGPESLRLNLRTMKFMPDSQGRYKVDEFRQIVRFVRDNRQVCMGHWKNINRKNISAKWLRELDRPRNVASEDYLGRMFRFDPKTFFQIAAADQWMIARENVERAQKKEKDANA